MQVLQPAWARGLLGVALALGSACSEDSETPGDAGSSTSGGSDSGSSGSDAASGTTTVSTSGSATGSGSSTTTDSTTSGPDTPSIGPADYIRGDVYPRLVLEVDAVEGLEPRDEAMQQIPAALATILDKPSGVEAILDETLTAVGSDHEWTFAELNDLATQTDNLEVAEDTVKMHILFLDGHYSGDDPTSTILGLAWGRTKLAIFKGTIEASCVGQVGMGLEERLCAGTERSVWVHEIGHLLGLVNLGTPMVTEREDPDHEHHDINEECVMYWAAERQNAVQRLANQLLDSDIAYLDFDDNCLADIAAVRDG